MTEVVPDVRPLTPPRVSKGEVSGRRRSARAVALLRFVMRRLVDFLGIIWAAATLTFLVLQLTPGDPVDILLQGRQGEITPDLYAAVRTQYGLDGSLAEQYLMHLRRIFTGDLGISYARNLPVTTVLSSEIGATVVLALTALAMALVIAVIVSVLAVQHGVIARSTATAAELFLLAMPTYWVGILLLSVLSYRLHWFPATGGSGVSATMLPALSIALPLSATFTQILRPQLQLQLRETWFLTALTRGATTRRILWRQALRHAATPLLTLSGTVFGTLLGGAVLIENLFGRPGLGRITLAAINAKDIPVILGVVVVSAVAFFLISTVVDLLYRVVDRRSGIDGVIR